MASGPEFPNEINEDITPGIFGMITEYSDVMAIGLFVDGDVAIVSTLDPSGQVKTHYYKEDPETGRTAAGPLQDREAYAAFLSDATGHPVQRVDRSSPQTP